MQPRSRHFASEQRRGPLAIRLRWLAAASAQNPQLINQRTIHPNMTTLTGLGSGEKHKAGDSVPGVQLSSCEPNAPPETALRQKRSFVSGTEREKPCADALPETLGVHHAKGAD